MKLAIGCDHGGYELKESLIKRFSKEGHEFVDFGTYSSESVDYPDFAFTVGEYVAAGNCDLGILVCSTGIGISIAANKVDGIRAAHCTDTYSAKMARRHNNANILALGAKITGEAIAEEIVEVFLAESFEGGRHQRRVDKIMDYKKQ